MSSPETRLQELGITLPTPPKPVAKYKPAVLIGNVLYVSGHGPAKIGDPALQLSMSFDRTDIRVFDLAELWKHHTGHGFVFAMWMTLGRTCPIDFAAARDEGLGHIDEIISNYRSELDIADEDMREYLTGNISYEIDDSMQAGLKLFFDLAQKHRLIQKYKPLKFVQSSAE